MWMHIVFDKKKRIHMWTTLVGLHHVTKRRSLGQ